MRLTDLLGHGVGLLRGVGHHAGRDGDAGLFQQPDAHVLVQGEVPLLLGHMASEQTRRTTQNLVEREEKEQEVTSDLHVTLLHTALNFLPTWNLNRLISKKVICGYHGNS